MLEACRKKNTTSILSPAPKRIISSLSNFPKRNPFFELPQLKPPGSFEEDSLESELSQILSKPATIFPPIGKKAPSPSLFTKNAKQPPRPKNNPVIYDEKFIEINSSTSTCESWY